MVITYKYSGHMTLFKSTDKQLAKTAKHVQLADKAKRPKPGIPLCKETMLKLIIQEGGNLSRVADMMGTTRTAIRNRCDGDQELRLTLDEARERRIDQLETSCFDDAINTRDTAMRCFLLKTQARHRGYEQDDNKQHAKDIASAAFEFILNKSKNPAEPSQ